MKRYLLETGPRADHASYAKALRHSTPASWRAPMTGGAFLLAAAVFELFLSRAPALGKLLLPISLLSAGLGAALLAYGWMLRKSQRRDALRS